MDFLIGIAIGVVVGWHVPQPVWATAAVEYIKTKLGMNK